jgi:hypothetical protein
LPLKKGDKRRRQKTLKKRAKRKRARRRGRTQRSTSTAAHIRRARDYPFDGCWAQEDWREHGLTAVVIARRQPDGQIVFGVYLVDYYCLGVKDTYCSANYARAEFRRDHLPRMIPGEHPVEISPALAHELIYGAIEYAAQFGFKPHADFRRSRQILDPPDQHPRSGSIQFGYEGQPLYIQGPHDNVEAIMRRLMRTAGDGNFHYLVELPEPPPGWHEDDIE